jgi:hypothetical protein
MNVPIQMLELFGLHSRRSTKKTMGAAVAGVLASISLFFNVLSAAALGVHSL